MRTYCRVGRDLLPGRDNIRQPGHEERKKNVQRGLLTMHGHVSYLGAAISTPPR